MNFQSIINKYLGTKVGNGQCVIWAAQFASEFIPGMANYLPTPVENEGAYSIYTVFADPLPQFFDRVANTPDNHPPQGALVVWGQGIGEWGHIAVANGEGDTNGFYSYDANWSSQNVTREYHNYNNVLGWLVPKSNNQGGTMPASQDKVDETTIRLEYNSGLLRNATANEIKQRLDQTTEQLQRDIIGSGEHKEIQKLVALGKTVPNLQKQIKDLQDQLANSGADEIDKDTNTKVTQIWNWIKGLFNVK